MDATGFPQYRRYKNENSFFRIDSETVFEEVRRFGEKWIIEKHVSHNFADRNFINDLLYHFTDFADEISSSDYEQVAQHAQTKK